MVKELVRTNRRVLVRLRLYDSVTDPCVCVSEAFTVGESIVSVNDAETVSLVDAS